MVIVSRVQVFREQLNSSCTSFSVSYDIKNEFPPSTDIHAAISQWL